jgi:predicted MFS family arabinose efflux permease
MGIVGIVSFLLAEKRAGDYALIPLRLFRNVTFGLSSLLNFIIGIAMFGAIAMLPMYLQLVKGLTPTEAGLMMITFTVGILGGSITAGRTISASGTCRVFPILAVFISMLFSLAADKVAAGMRGAMQNADFLKVLKDPAVTADPANAQAAGVSVSSQFSALDRRP